MPRPDKCIAPGCRKPNKGPRFFYCCEEHREAKRADIVGWQDAFRQKNKEAKKKAKKAAKKAKKK